jgi:hypothetical protein
MEKDWKNRSKDPEYAAKRAHAKEAYLSDCWVYSVPNDKWYTPEEFMASGESVHIYRGREDLKRFKVIDPNVGLNHKREQLKRLQQEIAEMEARIKNYVFKSKRNKRI